MLNANKHAVCVESFGWPTLDSVEIILFYEPRLEPIFRMVKLLVDLTRRTDYLCDGCVWEQIIKPMIYDKVGYGRTPDRHHEFREPGDTTSRLIFMDGDDVAPKRTPVNIERWLSGSRAYDAISDALLAIVRRAHCRNGHGIGRGVQTKVTA